MPRSRTSKTPQSPELRTGAVVIDGIPVEVVRTRTRRANLRIRDDGSVRLGVPARGGSLESAGAFLSSKWDWVVKTRQRLLASPPPSLKVFSPCERSVLAGRIARFHNAWSERLGEGAVEWKIRRMKTRWGVCNWAKRRITYAEMLAAAPDDALEYIVVHEFTHFAVHGHGKRFQMLMDERLPDWRERRSRLSRVTC